MPQTTIQLKPYKAKDIKPTRGKSCCRLVAYLLPYEVF